MICFVIKN